MAAIDTHFFPSLHIYKCTCVYMIHVTYTKKFLPLLTLFFAVAFNSFAYARGIFVVFMSCLRGTTFLTHQELITGKGRVAREENTSPGLPFPILVCI
jgi:hypothetical protein